MDEPKLELDGSWKDSLEWFLTYAMTILFPGIYPLIDWSRGFEFLDKELSAISGGLSSGKCFVDMLVRVWLKNGSELTILIHIEVQSQKDSKFPHRMYRYNYRLHEHHGQMPLSLAIFGDDDPNWRPIVYKSELAGCRVKFEYPYVKLIDFRGREAELEKLNNPFVPVVLAHLKALETRGSPEARMESKQMLVRSLYDRGYTDEQVRQLFRVIDSMMTLSDDRQALFQERFFEIEKERTVPLISPTERSWLNKGIERGRLASIEMGLGVRFDEAGLNLIPRVQTIHDQARLEQILKVLWKANSIDEIEALLLPQIAARE